MDIQIDLNTIEDFLCVEPEVGEKLLPFYPEFLSTEEKEQFELHLQGCEYCQKWWKLWETIGLPVRIDALLKQAKVLLEEHQYDEAVETCNDAIELDPEVLDSEVGQDFFCSGAWLQLTAANIKGKDIMPYIFPSYAPGTYELAAATQDIPFPIMVNYADGKVKGKISAGGTSIFFELLEAREDFANGIHLFGRILQPSVALKVWQIRPGKKHRLGTIASLFGSKDLQDISDTLRTFRVFPITN